MGYALFAQRKIVLDAQLNSAQLQQTQRSNEQYMLAIDSLGLQQRLTSQEASQSSQLAAEYKKLASEGLTEDQRAAINASINALQNDFKQENDDINRQIYQIGVQEQAIELEVKRLDTMVTALDKQLQAVEEAEGSAIDRATPKFNGVG